MYKVGCKHKRVNRYNWFPLSFSEKTSSQNPNWLRDYSKYPQISGLDGLAKTLPIKAAKIPIKAAKNPAQGPRITPSTCSKYIAQLRHKPKDKK